MESKLLAMTRPRTKPRPLEAVGPSTPIGSHIAVDARLEAALIAQGITSENLIRVGLDDSRVGNWLGCKGQPNIDAAKVIRAVVGIGLNYLYLGTVNDAPMEVREFVMSKYPFLVS